MITLTICNHKGGTGKTTSSINIAAALGLSGQRVLVIDLDPQGFLTRMMGVSEPSPSESSLIIFDQDGAPDRLPIRRLSTFDLIPSSPALTAATRRLNKPTDVLWAKEFIEKDVSLHEYDVVIFDTAAAVTVYSLNALVASRAVLIPVLPEFQPVVGAEQSFQTSEMVRNKLNPDLMDPMFVFTMVDARKRNHHSYRKYMRDRYGRRVLDGIVRTCTTLSVSKSDGRTVYELDPHARGAIDYANVADELMDRIGSRAEREPLITAPAV